MTGDASAREVHVDATRAEAIALCAQHDAPIAVIETLRRGVRVVFHNHHDAAIVAAASGALVFAAGASV